MAKFGSLEISKLKIAENAITGFAEGTTTLTVVNSYGMPLQLFAKANVFYSNIGSGQGWGSITFTKTAGGGALSGTETSPTFVGAGNYTVAVSMSFVDLNGLSGSHSYSLVGTKDEQGNAVVTISGYQIYAVYEKV